MKPAVMSHNVITPSSTFIIDNYNSFICDYYDTPPPGLSIVILLLQSEYLYTQSTSCSAEINLCEFFWFRLNTDVLIDHHQLFTV